jgi:hypothetical protein
MERLQVSVILADECTARACRLDVSGNGFSVSGGCDLHADEPCWQGEGLLVGAWLAPGGGAGWLEQAWAATWHLRASRRVEAVLPEVAFGRFVVRALLEEFAGQPDALVAAEQAVTINAVPPPLSRLRRGWQGVGFRLGGPA